MSTDQTGRRRAGLDHVRPRAEEQSRSSSPTPRSTTCSSRRSPTTSPHYLARGKAGFHELLTDFLTGKGTLEQADWAWDELLAFVRAATQTPVRNPLLTTYWTMAAVRHGDYVAKIRVAPAAESAAQAIHRQLDLTSGPGRVSVRRWRTSCKRDAFDFDLQVQLCTDLDAMPVNDRDRGMAREAVPLRHRRTGAPSAPGHLGAGELREGRRPRVQPVACHVRSPAVGRDHGRATHLQRVRQGPPDAQPPAANRAHQCESVLP